MKGSLLEELRITGSLLDNVEERRYGFEEGIRMGSLLDDVEKRPRSLARSWDGGFEEYKNRAGVRVSLFRREEGNRLGHV